MWFLLLSCRMGRVVHMVVTTGSLTVLDFVDRRMYFKLRNLSLVEEAVL